MKVVATRERTGQLSAIPLMWVLQQETKSILHAEMKSRSILHATATVIFRPKYPEHVTLVFPILKILFLTDVQC